MGIRMKRGGMKAAKRGVVYINKGTALNASRFYGKGKMNQPVKIKLGR